MPAGATDRAILVGGEGNLAVESQEFGDGVRSLGEKLRKRGGEPQTFTADRASSASSVAELRKALEGGRSGEQVFFAHNGHGAATEAKQVSRDIILENGSPASLDALPELVCAATRRGVRVAIADFWCCPGAVHELKDCGACCASPLDDLRPRTTFR